MSRVEASSGARYSAHKEAPRRYEPIAPVGTNYTPVGRPDIASMRAAAAPTAPKPSVPSAPRPVPTAPSPAPGLGRVPVASRAPADAWPEESAPAPPPAPPSATRPPVLGSAAAYAASVRPCFLRPNANLLLAERIKGGPACACSCTRGCPRTYTRIVRGVLEAPRR